MRFSIGAISRTIVRLAYDMRGALIAVAALGASCPAQGQTLTTFSASAARKARGQTFRNFMASENVLVLLLPSSDGIACLHSNERVLAVLDVMPQRVRALDPTTLESATCIHPVPSFAGGI